MVTCSYPSLFILWKYRGTYVFNKNIIGNFGREYVYRQTMERLDGNYLESMEKLQIIDSRIWEIFRVVSLIFNVFLSHDVAK